VTAVRRPVVFVVTAGALVLGACAPQPTRTERYCDVVKRQEATVDPFAVPSVLADPARLSEALQSRTKLIADELVDAPDAVRADLGKLSEVYAAVQSAMAAAGYVASAADAPAVRDLLTSDAFKQAERNVARFDSTACALGVPSSTVPGSTTPGSASTAPGSASNVSSNVSPSSGSSPAGSATTLPGSTVATTVA
jgi:hypothetical protein